MAIFNIKKFFILGLNGRMHLLRTTTFNHLIKINHDLINDLNVYLVFH